MWILWGIFFIVAGASGQFVLRGTESPKALIVAGVVATAWGIIDIFRKKAAKEKEEAEILTAVQINPADTPPLAAPCSVEIIREKRAMGYAAVYPLFLNEARIGELKNGSSVFAKGQFESNVLTSPSFPGKFEFQAASGASVRISLLKSKNKNGEYFEVLP